MDTKIFDYKEESDKWYNEKIKLYQEGKFEEYFAFNEQYLLSLKGRYNEEGPGSLAFDILKSLIVVSFNMKRFNYALEKALELMSLDLSAIKRYDVEKESSMSELFIMNWEIMNRLLNI